MVEGFIAAILGVGFTLVWGWVRVQVSHRLLRIKGSVWGSGTGAH